MNYKISGYLYPSQIISYSGLNLYNFTCTSAKFYGTYSKPNTGHSLKMFLYESPATWMFYIYSDGWTKMMLVTFNNTSNENQIRVESQINGYTRGNYTGSTTSATNAWSSATKYSISKNQAQSGQTYIVGNLNIYIDFNISPPPPPPPLSSIGRGIDASAGVEYVFGSSDSKQFPLGDDGYDCIYILSSGTISLNYNIIKEIYLLGGGAGGSTGSTSATKGGGGSIVKNTDTYETPILNITIGDGGTPNQNGDDTVVVINNSKTLTADGGTINASSTAGALITYNNLYYGGSGGISNGNGYIGGGGGGGGNAGNYGSAYMTAGGKGGGISASLPGGNGGAKGYQAGGGNNSGGTGGYGVVVIMEEEVVEVVENHHQVVNLVDMVVKVVLVKVHHQVEVVVVVLEPNKKEEEEEEEMVV